MHRGVKQEDARPAWVDGCVAEDGAVSVRMRGIAVVNTDQLQSVDLNLLVVEFADPSVNQRLVIFSLAVELFVVAGNVVDPVRNHRWGMRRREFPPGLSEFFKVAGRTVVEIAGQEDDVRLQ